MKKFILFLIVPFMSLCVMFAGCASQSQNVAKSLDDTITNLIYTVSSLDWADSEILESISSPAQGQEQDLASQTQDNTISMQNAITDNNANYNINQQQIMNDANARMMIRRKDLIDMRAQTQQTPYNPELQQNIPYQTNLSNQTTRPAKLSRLTRSRIYEQNKQSVSQSIANSNFLTSKIAAINAQAVNYSTEAIEENSSEVYQKISDLINKRATILVYLNPLYNRTAELSKENISAINAYINIIKDNNSYLKNNKGMVSNQLSQANSVKNNNASSPLINAYIIRTNEALQTRISKLDAALMAIDAISDILSACIDNPIPQTYQSKTLKLPLTDDNKISMDNKTANNEENQCENCEKVPDKSEKTLSKPQNNTIPESVIIKPQTSDKSPANQNTIPAMPQINDNSTIQQQTNLPSPLQTQNKERLNDIITEPDIEEDDQAKLIEEGIITEPKQLRNVSPNQNIENLDKLAKSVETSVVAKNHYETHPSTDTRVLKDRALTPSL